MVTSKICDWAKDGDWPASCYPTAPELSEICDWNLFRVSPRSHFYENTGREHVYTCATRYQRSTNVCDPFVKGLPLFCSSLKKRVAHVCAPLVTGSHTLRVCDRLCDRAVINRVFRPRCKNAEHTSVCDSGHLGRWRRDTSERRFLTCAKKRRDR